MMAHCSGVQGRENAALAGRQVVSSLSAHITKDKPKGIVCSQNATGDFSNIPMRLELQTLHEGDGAESSDLLPSVPAATFSLTLDFK